MFGNSRKIRKKFIRIINSGIYIFLELFFEKRIRIHRCKQTEMEGNCIRERDKKGRFKKASSTATITISTCTDENNNHPDFTDVNSEDPLAQVDEYDENKETFDLFQGRRVVEFSILVDHLQRGCFLCHTPLDLVDCEEERCYGLASLLYVRCRKCDELTIIPTGKRHNIGQNGQGPFDINTKLAVDK
ncbi:uncharacterized protein LOC125677692 isoform X2 [Ostrea edulis]|uniref:uncharacterized protein LOC125677692 isoform X2 n=1 Tax=Ostrea edulis TaxID=37623 RepID=UPI0024AF2F05|nr:uncharacterized protein LOC125677692 isoform X2 [Ostrea edulis]